LAACFFKLPFHCKRRTLALVPTVVKATAEIKSLNVGSVSVQVIENFEEFYRVKLN